jgi:hypothetical protein
MCQNITLPARALKIKSMCGQSEIILRIINIGHPILKNMIQQLTEYQIIFLFFLVSKELNGTPS